MLETGESQAGLTTTVIDDEPALLGHLEGWDELAVAAGRPFCSPCWMLAWWRHGRSGEARLRVVLVHDGAAQLVGVAPFFAQIGPLRLAEYRLLSAGFSHRLGLLARAGRESDVAAAVAQALARARPRPASIVFEGIDAGDRWPELVAAAWPGGRAITRTDLVMDAPAIELGGNYEAWLGRRDRRFRKESRRTGRRLEEQGVQARLRGDQGAVDALIALHDARWRDRGGSNVGDCAHRVVSDAAAAFASTPGRMSVAVLDAPAGPIAAELTLTAGRTMAFWGGGFDPEWAAYAPGTQAMLTALADAGPRNVANVDLGGGAHDYKRRLADAGAPLAWRTVFPLGPRYPLIRLRLAPKHARLGLRSRFRALDPDMQRRLRRALRR